LALLEINIKSILNNINKLGDYLNQNNISWSLITKVFSGNEEIMKNILTDDVLRNIHSVGDSRLSNLKVLKSINPDVKTIYIKPPAILDAEDVVEYADISLNSSFETIKALNKAAAKKRKIHQVIIMMEMGELREGILPENIVNLYKTVFNFENIKIVGIGTNLGCLYGVEPTYDKLIQLSLYKQIIELKFNQKIELISGGSSVTLPLIEKQMLPKEINHLRIGTTAFLGNIHQKQFLNLSTETIKFSGNIIELKEKKFSPTGIISGGGIGDTSDIGNIDYSKEGLRAILDFGIIDVNINDLIINDNNLKFIGSTSDMTIFEVLDNFDNNKTKKYEMGDSVYFTPKYMAVARLLNSKFIDKRFIK
jgi:predicted amino acid racemase